jgi:hypothetical protein
MLHIDTSPAIIPIPTDTIANFSVIKLQGVANPMLISNSCPILCDLLTILSENQNKSI